MQRTFSWWCSSCERYVHNRFVFAHQGAHFHWNDDNLLCGPVKPAAVTSDADADPD
jgi:hypothetical protein